MGDDKRNDPIKKIKSKAWRWCRCGCGFLVGALVAFAIGIALLVHFGKGLQTKESTDYGLSIFAIVLILIGVAIFSVGFVFCTCVYILYRKLTKKPTGLQFTAPTYDYGKAPYPQQNWGEGGNPNLAPPGQPGAAPTAQPTAPPDAVDTAGIVPQIKADVKVEPPPTYTPA